MQQITNYGKQSATFTVSLCLLLAATDDIPKMNLTCSKNAAMRLEPASMPRYFPISFRNPR